MMSYPANNTWSRTYRQSWQEIITSTDKRLKAAVSAPTLITVTAVKLQMFGGETCQVHVKVDHAGHENDRQK